jgi:predicted dehydrogenase
MIEYQDRPDAIIVAADPLIHSHVATAALMQGVHVFVEKPPAVSTRAIRDLAQLEATCPGICTFVGYNFEYCSPLIDGLMRLRRFSDPAIFNARFTSSGPRERGVYGSVAQRLVWDTLIHPLHLSLSNLGPPRSVVVNVTRMSDPMINISLLIEHDGGGRSTIEVGNHGHRFDLELRVVGKSGENFQLDELSRGRFSGFPGSQFGPKDEVASSWPPRRSNAACIGYVPALNAFLQSIVGGKPTPSPFRDSVTTIGILEDVDRTLGLVDGGGAWKLSYD